jgi:uncharacterized protein YbjT (DUF2867 family)
MRVAVAGGTGLLGRLVVRGLSEAGHEPVILARSRGVDLTNGSGLDQALTGCEVVVDVSNVSTTRSSVAVAFFSAATEHLLNAGVRAGVRHHVALSVVGADRVDFGYYLGKRRQEELVADAGVGWTVLRSTQFHEFAAQLLARTRGILVPTLRMLVQPIAAREVAAALVERAAGEPAGFVTPIAGPERHQLVDMTRQLIRARRQRRMVLPIRLPGRVGQLMADGGLLPQGRYSAGRQTFAEYLSESGAGRS